MKNKLRRIVFTVYPDQLTVVSDYSKFDNDFVIKHHDAIYRIDKLLFSAHAGFISLLKELEDESKL